MRNYTAKLDASQTMFNDKVKIEFGMFGSRVDKRYLDKLSEDILFCSCI